MLLKKIRHYVYPSDTIQDVLFLSLVVLLSVILYVWHLGFYSDDWAFLASFNFSELQSIVGLFQSAYTDPLVHMRPVQIFYLASLYYLFGLYPLGYHLVNAAVFLLGIVLFYLVLRELGQWRILALAVTVVYALLPHYSTDRFWFSAFQANLSLTLYFLSLYADLRSLTAKWKLCGSLKLLGILCLLGSTLAYEVFLPLFFLNLLITWYQSRKLSSEVPAKLLSRTKLAVLIGSNLLVLIIVAVFKVLTTTRAENFDLEHLVSFAKILKEATIMSYGKFGLGLPLVITALLRDYFNWALFTMGVLLGLIVFVYLYRVVSESKAELLSQIKPFRVILQGLVVFGFGYAIFVTVGADITSTGINNRINIAAAVGVALSVVGALWWTGDFLDSKQLRGSCFCILVALFCTSGFWIINTLASFWIDAYRKERDVLADIRQHIPTLPIDSTLILDGVCPYVGPAVVFESDWDLKGALQILYRDNSLGADVTTAKIKVNENGLSTSLYGDESHYQYDEKLFIYDYGRKMLYPVADAKAAYQYFQSINPGYSHSCTPGHEGLGVKIF